MSKLDFYGRPWVAFDPSNREHRKHYSNFLRTGSWGGCPYRFVVSDDFGDNVTMIQRALLKWYSEDEFSTRKK